jgi:hypothetical protein
MAVKSTMSSTGRRRGFRFMKTENEKPNTASTSPEASIGSRTGKPTFSNFMLLSSRPLTDLKIGHWA